MTKKIYLDYAATTPVDPRVAKKMLPYFSDKFGNTMSLHQMGQEAKQVLDESREIIADFIAAKPQEIIFTSSATESNNLALKGIALANKQKGGPTRTRHNFTDVGGSVAGGHIIISSIEHPCVSESAKWLSRYARSGLAREKPARTRHNFTDVGGSVAGEQGFEITKLKVDKYGLVDLQELKNSIRKDTILVSIIHASNEIGTIQPIAEIGKICRENEVYFHTDAAQSFGKISIDVNKMNIDLLTASSHKMYGPKGAALLFIREGIKIEPLLHGGGQESGLRSSTINIPAIVGFAEAVRICKKEMTKEGRCLTKLSNKLIKGVLAKISGSHLNGHPQKRLPNNANFWFEFVEGEAIVIRLDMLGIFTSTGSACASAKLEPSDVLLAIGLKHQQAHASVRFSLGRWTKEKDIDYLLKVLPGIIKELRKISGGKHIN